MTDPTHTTQTTDTPTTDNAGAPANAPTNVTVVVGDRPLWGWPERGRRRRGRDEGRTDGRSGDPEAGWAAPGDDRPRGGRPEEGRRGGRRGRRGPGRLDGGAPEFGPEFGRGFRARFRGEGCGDEPGGRSEHHSDHHSEHHSGGRQERRRQRLRAAYAEYAGAPGFRPVQANREQFDEDFGPDDDEGGRFGRGFGGRFGRGPFGPGQRHGFGPGGEGFGPGGFGPGGPGGPGRFGPGGPGGPGRGGWGPGGHGRGRGRRPRGNVRAAVLALLNEEPRHGYSIMTELTERSGGLWRPSPGSVYPVLQQLEDEGLVSVEKIEGRKVFSLTDAGRQVVTESPTEYAEPWNLGEPGPRSRAKNLFEGLGTLGAATQQVARLGTPAQAERARAVLDEARRAMYRILAEDDAPGAAPADPEAGHVAPADE